MSTGARERMNGERAIRAIARRPRPRRPSTRRSRSAGPGLAIGLAGLCWILACGDDDGPLGPESRVSEVEIRADATGPLLVGETRDYRATPVDEAGAPIPEAEVVWTVSDSSTLSVDSVGTVTARAVGVAAVIATAGRRSGATDVEVVRIPAILALGGLYTCGLDTAGRAYCWGDGRPGLGLGATDTTNRPTPQRVATDRRFGWITAGRFHTCGLGRDGRVACWGENDGGQLGDGTTTARATPTSISGDLTFESIHGSLHHTCGLTPSGEAYCWGRNGSGQLGDGTTVDRSTPVPVGTDVSFAAVSAGVDHTCALTPGGSVYCWGGNRSGQLGTRAPDGSTVPVPTDSVLKLSSITAGSYYTCGLTSDGETYCWGSNTLGKQGTRPISGPEPVRVAPDLTFRSLQAAIHDFTCGVTAAGDLYCWGHNDLGQLGRGTRTNAEPEPARLEIAAPVRSVHTSGLFACAVTTGDQAWCWGAGSPGNLGDGAFENRLTPVEVLDPF